MESEYSAHIEFCRKKMSGKVRVVDEKLEVLSGDGQVLLTADEYSMQVHFNKNREIVLNFSSNEKLSVKLRHPSFENLLKEKFGIKIKSGYLFFLKKNEWAAYTLIFFAIFFVAFSISLSSGFLAGQVSQSVSSDYELELGESILASIDSQDLIQLDEKSIIFWEQLLSQLTESLGAEKESFKFYFIRDKSANAFSLPGRIILINSGLVLNADSAEEIIGVIAHEMGHAVHRHNLKQYIRLNITGFIIGFFFAGSHISLLFDELTSFQHMRDQEVEADQYARSLLEKSGLSTAGLVGFFKKTKKLESQLITNRWLSTHPVSEDRIQFFSDSKMLSKRRIDFPLVDFKKLIH